MVIRSLIEMLLECDEAVDAAYLTMSDAPWDHQVRLDDARGINFAADHRDRSEGR
jgi:hypothetical protein